MKSAFECHGECRWNWFGAVILTIVLLYPSGSAAQRDQDWRPSHNFSATAELVELGRNTYTTQCATCHGPKGQGDGQAAYLLYPKPRDFTAAKYRLVSTWERMPTDEDLFYTISRGMPGSAMPSWVHLSEQVRWGLVHYIKSFANKTWEVVPAADPKAEGMAGQGVISVPSEPAYTEEAKEQAAYYFKEACAGCHGSEGRGDGVQIQVDSEGYPTRPRDLTLGIFKGSTDSESIYRRIVIGLPGTPMPMSDWSYGEAAWHLVHYVLSLSSPDQREGAPLRSLELTAEKTKRLPEVMDGSFWEKIPGAQVGLTPLWWRDDRVENVSVQAVHDRKRLAIRLSWKDIHPNQRVVFQNEFTDGAAIQFSEAEAPPLFTMGTLESPVNIWHWKAVWQQDQDEGETKLVDVFPTMSRNLYAGSPKEAVYMTSRAVGNPVAQAAHHSPVEDVNAGGFGTLTSQPTESQNVDGVARWVDGQWEVVFVRDLKSRQAGDIQLKPGGKVSVALAVWDGDAADRNGQKSVSIWQVLTLEK